MRKIFKSKSGEGYVDLCVLVLVAMFVIALAIKIFPVFIEKHNLDVFATELMRTAEIAGRVGAETDAREFELRSISTFDPLVTWSRIGNVQLNDNISVTVTLKKDIGLFGGVGSFPVALRADASGKSEVYWK